MSFRYTLRQLEYFVAVGKAGSIAAASAKVGVSSPSISAAITQLEEEVGLTLFVREHVKGLSLTEAGTRFMEQATLVLSEAARLTTLAGEITGTAQGRLKVGCLLTIAQVVLPALRRSFEEVHPSIEVTQRVLNQAEIFSHLRREELDIALTYDLDTPADMVFEPLLNLPPYVMCGADHPFADRDELAVKDLKDHPMVLLDLPYSSDYFMSFFTRAGFRPHVAERTSDMSVMRTMVANGYGFSIATIPPLNDRAPDGRPLRFIPLTGRVKQMQIGLLRLRAQGETATQNAFSGHCRKMVEKGALPMFRQLS